MRARRPIAATMSFTKTFDAHTYYICIRMVGNAVWHYLWIGSHFAYSANIERIIWSYAHCVQQQSSYSNIYVQLKQGTNSSDTYFVVEQLTHLAGDNGTQYCAEWIQRRQGNLRSAGVSAPLSRGDGTKEKVDEDRSQFVWRKTSRRWEIEQRGQYTCASFAEFEDCLCAKWLSWAYAAKGTNGESVREKKRRKPTACHSAQSHTQLLNKWMNKRTRIKPRRRLVMQKIK